MVTSRLALRRCPQKESVTFTEVKGTGSMGYPCDWFFTCAWLPTVAVTSRVVTNTFLMVIIRFMVLFLDWNIFVP